MSEVVVFVCYSFFPISFLHCFVPVEFSYVIFICFLIIFNPSGTLIDKIKEKVYPTMNAKAF